MDSTIIAASLDDKELKKSIEELVTLVAQKANEMGTSFGGAMSKMVQSMKEFTNAQAEAAQKMKATSKDMSTSFDEMSKAQSSATSSNSRRSGNESDGYPHTIGELEEIIALETKRRKEMELGSDKLREQNKLLAEYENRLSKETRNPASSRLSKGIDMPTSNLDEAEKKLRLLEILQRRYAGTTELSVQEQNRLARAIAKTKEQIDKMRPKTLKEVLGMDESSIDAIARKLRALKSVQIAPNNTAQVKQLGTEYQRLSKLQTEMMGKNLLHVQSNNALARSFGYIRNRVVYALTLGAASAFMKNLYEIRGQYELLERSLGVLVNSFEKGSQIFQELNEMAIKSPFTLVELGTAAKQLTAYNFAADEVVDTTRRLADISAALGVPMERLTYNLGQIKAQGVLNARDARDFANAGLAIVPMLAQMYTEQKAFGDELVTTAQVYDMMSKKMVTYSDVLKVLQKVTDEGGKFFDFQAKQADTLRVQMANLTLAYNNMLNEIGTENQGVLSGLVKGVRTLFNNWKEVNRVILTLITTFGTYKAVATIVSALNSRMFVGRVIVSIKQYIKGIKDATGAMATFNAVTKLNLVGFLASVASALAAAVGYFVLFKNEVAEVSQEVEMFGESAAKTLNKVDTLKKIIAGTDETSSTYKKTLSELSSIAQEYGVHLDAEKASRKEINSATERTIQLIQEESAERERANQLKKAQEQYDATTENAKNTLRGELKSGFPGTVYEMKAVDEELTKNADAIADIIGSVVQQNIMLIAGKTDEEYKKGLDEMFSLIGDRLRAIGISEKLIKELTISKAVISKTGEVEDYIRAIAAAKDAQENYNDKIEKNYKAAKDATKSTMTFTEKVDANARALLNNAQDALSLYNRVYDLVKLAKENHVINFDLKLTADEPPKWMFDKSLPELQKLAERFAAIAQSGGRAAGYTNESTYERALQYAAAARQKQEEEERKARLKNNTTRTKQSDKIAAALKEEISLVKRLQGEYDTLIKKGATHADAMESVQSAFKETISALNKDLKGFNLPELDLSIMQGKDPNKTLEFFENLRDILKSKGLDNLERMKVVEGVIEEFRVKAKTYNLDMVTKGLNSELGKLKEEYELAVELDANPELGDMFADVFKIGTSTLPKTFAEAIDKANKIAIEKLKENNVNISDFDFLSTNITPDKDGKWKGMSISSDLVQALIKAQKDWRVIYKKNTQDIEKELDGLVKKYGTYADKVYEIEQKRLERIKKLNEEYSEDRRNKPEYQAKRAVIDKDAARETDKAAWEDFKESDLFIRVFQNLDRQSTQTLTMMRTRLAALKSELKNLSPEQLKAIAEQMEKIDDKLVERNPFKNMGKTIKEYIKAIKNKKQVDKEAQTNTLKYNDENKKLVELEKQLAKARQGGDKNAVQSLEEQVRLQRTKTDAAKKEMDSSLAAQLGISDAMAQMGNLAKFAAQEFANFANAVVEIRDTLADVGVEFSDDINFAIEGLSQASEGTSEMVNSLLSLNPFGVISGFVKQQIGYGKMIAGLFGKGKKDYISKIKETMEDLIKVLDKVASYQLEAMGKMTGSRAVAEYQKLIDNNNRVIESYQQMAHAASRSGSSAGARSYGYRTDKALRGQWEKISEVVGQSVRGTYELINLSAEQLKTLMIEMPDVWQKIDPMIREYLDQMVEYGDKATEYAEAFAEALTNISLDDLTNDFEGLLQDMDNGTKEFAENFEEYMRNAIIRSLMVGTYTSQLEAWYKNFQERIKDDDLSRGDIEALREEYMDIVSRAIEERDNLFKAMGLDSSERDLSALQQGINGITEETAGALEAYMNQTLQQVYYHSTLLEEIRNKVAAFDLDVQLGTLSQMLLQMQQSYQVQQNIASILNGVLNPSGRAIVVELN